MPSQVRHTRSRDAGFALASCAVLAAYNNVLGTRSWHHRYYLPLNAGATSAALAAAAAAGLTAADLGVGPGRWSPGRLGGGLAGVTAAGWLLVAAVPVSRPVLGDKRIADLDGRALVYQVLLRIPVGTVLWEEVAFRGILQASLLRVMPPRAAIAVASGVFGVWHIRPSVQALRANGLLGSRRQAVAGVAGAVAATAAGGAFLAVLRARSGRLAAPAALHLAANCAGPIAAWAVARPLARRAA